MEALMKKLFIEKELLAQTFVNKIFNRPNKKNILIEINNLFASKDLLLITEEDIKNITDTYKINLEKTYQNELLEYYKIHLDKFLENKSLSNDQNLKLEHIRKILKLREAENIFIEKTKKIFELEINNIVNNEEYDEEYFNTLKKNLSISDEVGADIYKNTARNYVEKYINGIISVQRFSPEQENKLEKMTKGLNLDLNIKGDIKEKLDKCKLLWQIDNGNLPVEDCALSLQNKEICHFIADIEWLEQRTVTKKVNYAGLTTRFRLAKGVYIRTGSIKPLRVTEDIWKMIDSGRVFITSKRIIFVGGLGNKSIPLNKIIDFSFYLNGIEIEKDTGRSPFLQFHHNTDICALILANLLGIPKDLPENASGLQSPDDFVNKFKEETASAIAANNAELEKQLNAIKQETDAKMAKLRANDEKREADLESKHPELAAQLKAIREKSDAKLKAIDERLNDNLKDIRAKTIDEINSI